MYMYMWSCGSCYFYRELSVLLRGITNSYTHVLNNPLPVTQAIDLVLLPRFYMGTRPVVVVAEPSLLDTVLKADCHTFTTAQQVL